MFKKILTLCAFGLLTGVVAKATTISPGGSVPAGLLSFGGTDIQFIGGSVAFAGGSANYALDIWQDPSNTFCSGCLDFVFLIDNQSTSEVFDHLSLPNFFGTNNVGYATGSGNVAPTTITDSLNGMITFDFATGIQPHQVSNYLVIQTDFSAFNVSSLNLTDAPGITHSAPSFQPVPEPSTLMLFGSGVLGLAGAAKRKFKA